MSDHSFAAQQPVWDCLRWFDETPRTEAHFGARMKELAADDVVLLKAFYGVADDRELLGMVCTFWNVPISRPKAG